MIKKLRDFDENSSVVNNVAETIGRIVQHVIIKEFSSFHNLMLKVSASSNASHSSFISNNLLNTLSASLGSCNSSPLICCKKTQFSC